ncbi:hypothetical protein O181_054355 [Austropuccinia psidii MF-1]|uniref:Uncharacterized protein n=1 Tax=Austropuccinia psidii MF-1 TaxID=1389203 RepID=A0A9Q3E8P8_9BASI|nr:hypothetical protein [Austropuccinia psidii MF-1]
MAEEPFINHNRITYSDGSPSPSKQNIELPVFSNFFSSLSSPFCIPSRLLTSMDYEDTTSQDGYSNDYNCHPSKEQHSSVEDLTPPTIPKRYIKRRQLCSNIYDYFEKISDKGDVTLAILGNNTSNLNKHQSRCCGRFNAWASKAPGSVDPTIGERLAAEEHDSIMKDLVKALVAIQV